MDPLSWLGLVVLFYASYAQISVFYIHAYGTTGGWTTILKSYPEDIKIVGIPGALFSVYFVVMFGLRGAAVFLAWDVLYENIGNTVDVDIAKRDLNAIMICFVATIVFGLLWSKCFFNPPKPFFLSSFIFALLSFTATSVSIYFYDSLDRHSFGDPPEHHVLPLTFQILYLILYDLVILILSFYCLFNSRDPTEELGIGGRSRT
jgi:hypothetical protein